MVLVSFNLSFVNPSKACVPGSRRPSASISSFEVCTPVHNITMNTTRRTTPSAAAPLDTRLEIRDMSPLRDHQTHSVSSEGLDHVEDDPRKRSQSIIFEGHERISIEGRGIYRAGTRSFAALRHPRGAHRDPPTPPYSFQGFGSSYAYPAASSLAIESTRDPRNAH
ncbi:hypothetical protein WN55_07159 [Dufourea novaeangliae]|uniref:Uncharacterized protein n=1 Tax=Dufourea novaeangliae TaxID=178035 RepID=A0A154P2L6_DUFNO|nr:hypothetical protein WN55_07159 [Dufourea novaeangliae]